MFVITESLEQPHWIPLQGAVNARVVVPQVLVRSDNLQSLTAADVRQLVDEQAVAVVLDLRTEAEVELEGPGPMHSETTVRIEHRSLHPESGDKTDLEAGAVRPWHRVHADGFADEAPVIRAYLGYLANRQDSVVGAIRSIARAERAVLVHCAAGKDRTGVLVALALDAVGTRRELIVADYVASSQRIDQILRRLLSSETYRRELEGQDAGPMAPRPATMERFLAIIDEQFGGSARWLLAHGLDPHDLRRLRRRLTELGTAAAA